MSQPDNLRGGGRELPATSPFDNRWAIPAAVLLYVFHAVLALPLTGLQYDELLHLAPILPPERVFGTIRFGDTVLPSMLLPYLGCLKTWLVWPWIELLPRSPESIRIPAILVGAAALALSAIVLKRLAGPTVAGLTALLAATDTTFVFCTTYDWGPVGLQLLVLAGVAWSAIRFHESGAAKWAGLSALLVGLAIWNKALALWMLSSLGLVILLLVPDALRRWLRPTPLAAVILCFVLGAYPFLAWNKKNQLSTFRENRGVSLAGLAEKTGAARVALDGSQFLGYMVREDIPAVRGAASVVPLLHAAKQAGWRFGNGIVFALMLSLLAGPLLLRGPRLRLWLGMLMALAFALFQMMVTNGAGTGMHHYVLLFPLPFVVIAMPLAALVERRGVWRKAGLLAATALVSCSAVALHAQFTALRAWGPTPIWSTAITDLVATLRQAGARHVWALEWGTDSQLRYLLPPAAQGGLGYEFLDAARIPDDVRLVHLARLREANTFYVRYEAPHPMHSALADRFRAFAQTEGFDEETVAIVHDAWGVPIYRVLRYRSAALPATGAL
ncbi:MAG: glycosyltransferase family 39 protein [Bryobacterales bacterium]|nr:glycosyltransferase family 39 protein [Bryobacterales bacterium]